MVETCDKNLEQSKEPNKGQREEPNIGRQNLGATEARAAKSTAVGSCCCEVYGVRLTAATPIAMLQLAG
jgi:hypothetical protein